MNDFIETIKGKSYSIEEAKQRIAVANSESQKLNSVRQQNIGRRETLQKQFDKYTLHSGNVYQIFTYVKSMDFEMRDKPHEVSGMLLYAKTDDTHQPDPKEPYLMRGNKIMVRTLDLNCDFD